MSKIKVTIETNEGSFTAESKRMPWDEPVFVQDVLAVFAKAMEGLTYSDKYVYCFEHDGNGPFPHRQVRHTDSKVKISKKTKKAVEEARGE